MEVHLGFWLQVFLKAEIIQNCLGSMRLEHIRRLTPSSGAIPLRLSHASNVVHRTLAKSCKTSRLSRHLETVPWPLLRWSSNKQPCGIWLGASCHLIQVEVKVIPHCPFWVFPIVNAVSKKSSLSHPFDGFPHVNARFTE